MLQGLQGKEVDVVLFSCVTSHRGTVTQGMHRVQTLMLQRLQGKEADVVVFSCVRAHDGGSSERGRGVGFLADVRRMNVGLTRARYTILHYL